MGRTVVFEFLQLLIFAAVDLDYSLFGTALLKCIFALGANLTASF